MDGFSQSFRRSSATRLNAFEQSSNLGRAGSDLDSKIKFKFHARPHATMMLVIERFHLV